MLTKLLSQFLQSVLMLYFFLLKFMENKQKTIAFFFTFRFLHKIPFDQYELNIKRTQHTNLTERYQNTNSKKHRTHH